MKIQGRSDLIKQRNSEGMLRLHQPRQSQNNSGTTHDTCSLPDLHPAAGCQPTCRIVSNTRVLPPPISLLC